MPSNNQPGGGPWSERPGSGGGGSNIPGFEELLRRSQNWLKRVLPGGGRNISPGALIAILAVGAALLA